MLVGRERLAQFVPSFQPVPGLPSSFSPWWSFESFSSGIIRPRTRLGRPGAQPANVVAWGLDSNEGKTTIRTVHSKVPGSETMLCLAAAVHPRISKNYYSNEKVEVCQLNRKTQVDCTPRFALTTLPGDCRPYLSKVGNLMTNAK